MELKSVVLMVGFFLLAAVGYKGVSIIRKNDMIIRTNGISTRHVVSDQICWEISFPNKASTIKEAQLKFVEDKEKVLSFLKKCGFSDDEITQDPPGIYEVCERSIDEVSKKEKEERFFKTEGCFTIRTARGEMVQECLSKTAELFEMGVLFY
ncbi:MAG: hypothetical protein LBI95_00730, partial [Holosporales bacterium]|nr:hypothetical protein [Holosporales bacterium]